MAENVFSHAAMTKILKKAGAERVSEQAKKELATILEERASKIAEKAVSSALRSGRKTIKKTDIVNN